MDGICRRCIKYQTRIVEGYDINIDDSDYTLEFSLTKFQKETSNKLINALEKGHVLLEAVCGAGKTEMCYELVRRSLEVGKKVGWAIPRRQVILELAERIQTNFKHIKVIPVCEGYTEDLVGDLIICTTHQLYNYHQYFDILIVDEVDAFPFYGDDLLFDFMKASVKGHILLMSATVTESLMNKFETIEHILMPFRPNLKPLPIPKVIKSYISIFKLLKQLKEEKVMIFIPTIKLTRIISFVFRIPFITSETLDKESVIESFKKDKKGKILCTTVLERGVTFKDTYVIVLEAHHKVYTKASLIQIVGRVMRGNSVKGSCYFVCRKFSKDVKECIEQLQRTNRYAESVLKRYPKDLIF